LPSYAIRKTVLCIDDQTVILHLLKAALEAHGYVALPIENSRKALNVAAALRVDAIIVDYAMPGMNGLEVAAALKQLQPDTPIILYAGSLHALPPALTAVDAFVAKGEGLEALLSVLARLLQAPKVEQRHVRRFPRYPVQLPFAVITDRRGEVSTLPGRAVTVGEGGLGGKVDGSLEPGELVILLLADPRLKMPFEPRARVRYHTRDTYGFEFVDVSPEQRAEVQRFCHQLASA